MNTQKTPILIRAIDHLVLRVINLERMLLFYSGVLGCNIARQQDAIGLVQLRVGDSLIDLVSVNGKLGLMDGAAPGRECRSTVITMQFSCAFR